MNDRNDRAIRIATKWYDEHLAAKKRSVRCILLTDDVGNRTKAKEEGLLAYSVEEYVKSLREHPELQDKLSKKNLEFESGNVVLFPAHLSASQIHDGIKCGKLHQGSFVASRDNYLEGFVNVEGIEKFVLVQGREGLNRAVDGDIVAIELFPKKMWSAPSDVILQDDEEDAGETLNEELSVLPFFESSDTTKDKTPTGKVVGIIRRKWRQYCGILQPSLLKGATRHIFVPAERKIPKVRIETRQAELLKSQRIIVAIDQWQRNSRF